MVHTPDPPTGSLYLGHKRLKRTYHAQIRPNINLSRQREGAWLEHQASMISHFHDLANALRASRR